ncbi:VOC family protein [Pararhodobacter zhoushanensis]|uniref:VOC family protein n=1 Tax=Pararhodobacter zhoushanensis TaxID=2479545 RepID=UPI000F8DDF6C|nr:VOC family protein [Pararhodobacter zhoushanensis]
MQRTSMFILYVSNPSASARFYAGALGAPVVHDAPDFALLVLGNGVQLGLWRTTEVTPAADDVAPASSELSVTLPDADALQALHDRLKAEGVTILQPVTQLDFGLNFTAADPDGHRLRPYVPSAR